MTGNPFNDRLAALAAKAGIDVSQGVCEQLEAYVQLLTLWNQRINLTALPLSPPTDEAFDRLLIEPLAAARLADEPPQAWFDIGSGGGSPAIPLKIAHPSARLTMVESKTKKAAFLREAIRVLELTDTAVIDERFETISDEGRARNLDLVTVRGVKGDPRLYRAIRKLLAPTGCLFLFHSPETQPHAHGFIIEQVARLGTADDARLTILKPMFHVEHRI